MEERSGYSGRKERRKATNEGRMEVKKGRRAERIWIWIIRILRKDVYQGRPEV